MKFVKPKYHYDVEQGTFEWLQLRLASLTATAVLPLFAKCKEWEFVSKGGKTLLIKKFKELLSGSLGENNTGDAIDHGHTYEPIAIKEFERVTGAVVESVGFVEWADYIASSPDGLIGDTDLVEIKCPFKLDIHLGYINKDDAPRNYKMQMLHQLITTERSTVWFCSFNPDAEEGSKLFIKSYTIDDLLATFKLTREEYENRILQVAQIIEILSECNVDVVPSSLNKSEPAVQPSKSCIAQPLKDPWDM